MPFRRCEAMSALFYRTNAKHLKQSIEHGFPCLCASTVSEACQKVFEFHLWQIKICLSPIGLWNLVLSEGLFLFSWQRRGSCCPAFTMKFSFAWLQNKLQNFQNVTFAKIVGWVEFLKFSFQSPEMCFSCLMFSLLFCYNWHSLWPANGSREVVCPDLLDYCTGKVEIF